MKTNHFHKTISTNDLIIRSALKRRLEDKHAKDKKVRIIEELGIQHGTARIDVAVVNGIMHGYEIKSDRDTLKRLTEQIDIFNSVFDRMTLVVGKNRLYNAINMVPDWWGIIVAKVNTNNEVFFQTIREAEKNQNQVGVSIAKLLWKEEALRILEGRNEADEVRYKPRELVYEKLADVLDMNTLKRHVNLLLISREGWRSDLPLMSGGD